MTDKAVKELKQRLGRWFKPTVARHMLHVETCERLNCADLIEPLQKFADEVLSVSEDKRDDLLQLTEIEPYVAFQRYPAYIEPTKAEQKLDFYSAEMGRRLR